MRQICLAAALLVIAHTTIVAAGDLSPCEAFGAAAFVFIGVPEPPVRRPLPPGEGVVPGAVGTFVPVTVEHVFRGPNLSVAYLAVPSTDLLKAGVEYLIFASDYMGSDMFMTSAQARTRPLALAASDLDFLNAAASGRSLVTISGVVELDDSDSAHIGSKVSPLANLGVRLQSGDDAVMTTTSADGSFLVGGLRPGSYVAEPILPDDLAVFPDVPGPKTTVRAGGCASLRLRVIPNGHIRGVMLTDSDSWAYGDVALMPAEMKPGEPDRYSQTVHVDRDGRFTFDRVRPGRYILGRLARTVNGIPVPAVYFPGTQDRSAAQVIEIERAETRDVGEFHVRDLP